jgi:hypothetical protein
VRIVLVGALLSTATTALLARNPGPTAPLPDDALRKSASRGIGRIEETVRVWHRSRTCFSCHHQGFAIAVVALARSRGVPIDEALARQNVSLGPQSLKSIDRAVHGHQALARVLATSAGN